MTTFHEPPATTAEFPRPGWGRFKFLAAAGIFACLILLIAFLALWNTFFVYVEPGSHLVITAKYGAPLPPHQVLADEEKGEKGVRKQVLGEGWHFVWPIVYTTEHEANTLIPAGKVGVVTARGGDPLPSGQALAEEGQQGIQRHVLPPGEYRLNCHGYVVDLADAVEIKPGYVGVRRLLGKGRLGIMPEVLQPGLYYINPKEYEVINAEVGIYQTAFSYSSRADQNTAIRFTSKGGFEISMDCTIEWEVQPNDMPALVAEYGIVQAKEPQGTVIYADRHKVEQNVIDLQAHKISRDKGIDYGVQELLEGAKREKFQEDFTRELVLACSKKNVAIHSAFIRNIVIPETYLKPIRDKQIAHETELTNRAKEATAQSEADVATQRGLVDQRVAEVQAETARKVAAIERDTQNIVTKTEAQIAKLKADYEANFAALTAEQTQVLGEAQAQVTKLKETAKSGLYQLKMDVFQNDANAYLRYTMAEQLNPKMSLRLMHSGPGTFWTNMDGKGMNLLMQLPAAPSKAAMPRAKEQYLNPRGRVR